MNILGDCWAQASRLACKRKEIQMLHLAASFVVGALPVGGVVATWSAWPFPVIGFLMILLLVLLVADSAGHRLSWSRTGIGRKPLDGATDAPASHARRCASVAGF
jgi:hypothetical protein